MPSVPELFAAKEGDPKGGVYEVQGQWCLTADGVPVATEHPQAQHLYLVPGEIIPLQLAKSLGIHRAETGEAVIENAPAAPAPPVPPAPAPEPPAAAPASPTPQPTPAPQTEASNAQPTK